VGGLLARGYAGLAELDEHLADLHRLAGLDVDLLDAPRHRRGKFNGRLVGLDLEQRGVLADHVALAYVHLADLGLRQSFTEVGQDEGTRHDGLHCTHVLLRRPAMTVSVNPARPGGTTITHSGIRA